MPWRHVCALREPVPFAQRGKKGASQGSINNTRAFWFTRKTNCVDLLLMRSSILSIPIEQMGILKDELQTKCHFTFLCNSHIETESSVFVVRAILGFSDTMWGITTRRYVGQSERGILARLKPVCVTLVHHTVPTHAQIQLHLHVVVATWCRGSVGERLWERETKKVRF